MVEFNKSSLSHFYKMYNTPYFLIDENIKLFNTIIRENVLVSNSEDYSFNDITRQIIEVDQDWIEYKKSLYQHESPAFEESNRISRITKYIGVNRTQFIDIAKFSKKVQDVNKLILDKNKYVIKIEEYVIQILSIAHKFENIKSQMYYFEFQVIHEMDWYKAYVKQLKLLYAVFNMPNVQELIRNAFIPSFVRIDADQVYYLRLLYNFCEYYGHIVPPEQVEPHLFTVQYMEIYNARNNNSLLSALGIVFMILYYNLTFVLTSDASKYLDYEKLVKNVTLGNTCQDILYSLLMVFPEILRFNDGGKQKIQDILETWRKNPGTYVGNLFPHFGMPEFKEPFDNTWFDNKSLRDLSLGNYSFFDYLGIFNKYHTTNVSYFRNRIESTFDVFLKYDSINLKVLNNNSTFYADIKLNKYPNGIIKDEKYNKILNNNVFIYNNNLIDIFSYIDFNYTNVDAFSVSINELASGHNVLLYESQKYYIKLIDEVVDDKVFYKSPSKIGVDGGGGSLPVQYAITHNVVNGAGVIEIKSDDSSTIDIYYVKVDRNDVGNSYSEYFYTNEKLIKNTQKEFSIYIDSYYPDEYYYYIHIYQKIPYEDMISIYQLN